MSPIQLANRAKLFCGNELESSNPVTSLDGFCRDVAPDLRQCRLRQSRLHRRFNAAQTSEVCFTDASNRRAQPAEADATAVVKHFAKLTAVAITSVIWQSLLVTQDG